MTIGSLFSGIGGLELGLEWAGLGPTVWQVEQSEFCRGVLARHWPDAERFEDVREVGAAELSPVDVICGGFPCQGNSSAGNRTGFAHSRTGLWSEFARVVGAVEPRWVVVENVASGAHIWVDTVVRELELRAYECLPIQLSAADVGAPHLRARVFIVARHTDRNRKPVGAVDAKMAGLSRAATAVPGWSEPPGVSVADGISAAMGAYGNAVVPQCSEVVGWVIRELEGAA